MDSVDGCCGLRKTDGFQNAQAGSTPNKVDLIIWEIEVPKVRAASSQFPGGQGHQVYGVGSEGGTAIQKKPLSEPEAGGKGTPHFAGFAELPAEGSSPPLPSGASCSCPLPTHRPACLPWGFSPVCSGSDLFGDAGKDQTEDVGRPGVPSLCSAQALQGRV